VDIPPAASFTKADEDVGGMRGIAELLGLTQGHSVAEEILPSGHGGGEPGTVGSPSEEDHDVVARRIGGTVGDEGEAAVVRNTPSLAIPFCSAITCFGPLTSDRAARSVPDSVVVGDVLDLQHHGSDGPRSARNTWVPIPAGAGGVADNGRFTFIADSATYAAGDHVMVFLRGRADGTCSPPP